MKRIGILGGSFNPVHIGHIEIAKNTYQQLSLDRVLFIPCLISPFKADSKVSFEERRQMVELAIKDYPYFSVSDIEKDLPLPSYTYNTIKALKELDQINGEENQYFLIIGADQGERLSEWYRIDELLNLLEIVVLSRDKVDINCQFDVIKLSIPLIDISSTDIRKGDFRGLPKLVRQYILDKELYLEDIVRNKMDEQRFRHTLSVQKTAIELASLHNLDPHKASLAGLLHDITKQISEEEEQALLLNETLEHKAYPKKVIHQFSGAWFSYLYLGIEDRDVLAGIYYHTTGEIDNPYVYLIYLADKLEPTRPYETAVLYEKAKVDLKGCFEYCRDEVFSKYIR